MNQTFLYILPFRDAKHFKIGISSKDFQRIKHLHKIYEIDFDKAYIVHSKKSNIKILEKELLEIFDNDECEKFNTDGHTEIRNVKYFTECLELVKNKHSNLNYTLTKFDTKIFTNTTERINKVKNARTDLNMTIIVNFMEHMEELFTFGYNVKKIRTVDANLYEVYFNEPIEGFYTDDLIFKLMQDNSEKRVFKIFGLIGTETSKNNKCVTFYIPEYFSEVCHYQYNDTLFEINDETRQLMNCFNQVLEHKQYCEKFGIKDSFQELLKKGSIKSPVMIDQSLIYNKVIKTDVDLDKHLQEFKKIDKKIAKILL